MRNFRIKIGNNIYLFLYMAFLVGIFYRYYDWGGSDSLLPSRIVSIISILANIIIYFSYQNNHIYKLGIIFVFILMLMFSLFINPIVSLQFVAVMFFLININLVSFTKFIKSDFFTRVILTTILIIINLLHLDPNNGTSVEVISHSGNSFRQSLGFGSPNTLGLSFLILFISGFVFSKLLNKSKCMLLFILMLFIYIIISKLSDSRVFEVNSLIILFALIFQRSKIWSLICEHISIPFTILSIVLSFFIIFFLNTNTSIFATLNGFSSNRISDQIPIMQMYPPKLYGYTNALSNLTISQGGSVSIDNMYMSLIIEFGIIGLLIYETLCVFMHLLSKKLNDKRLDLILIVLSLISLVVGYSANLMTIFIFSGSFYLYEKERC